MHKCNFLTLTSVLVSIGITAFNSESVNAQSVRVRRSVIQTPNLYREDYSYKEKSESFGDVLLRSTAETIGEEVTRSIFREIVGTPDQVVEVRHTYPQQSYSSGYTGLSVAPIQRQQPQVNLNQTNVVIQNNSGCQWALAPDNGLVCVQQ